MSTVTSLEEKSESPQMERENFKKIKTTNISFIPTVRGSISKRNEISNVSAFSNIKQSIRSKVLSIAYPMKFVTKLPSCTTTGLWYLTPEYHVFESSIMLLFASFVVYGTSFVLQSPDHILNTPLNSEGAWSFPLRIMHFLLTADYFFHIWHKSGDAPVGRGLWWMLQPCPMNQLFILIILYEPYYLTPQNILYLLTLTCGGVQALMFPDSQSRGPLSVAHFYLQHLLIVIVPWYWFIQYIDTISNFVSIWVVVRVHALGLLYQFALLLPSAIISGVNINYALSPPKPLQKYGTMYRPVMAVIWFLTNAVTGYIVPIVVVIVVWALSI